MPALSLESIIVWALGPALEFFCVYLLFRRKLLREFRFFASYLVFVALKDTLLVVCYRFHHPWIYFSAYWVGMAMADLFSIAVLYEIFCASFKPFAGLQDLAKVIFKWAAGSIVFLGILVFVSVPVDQPTKFNWLVFGVNGFERIVRVMECALLLFLFLGSQHLGVSKRNRVFGLALGFGFDALFQLIVWSAAASSHLSSFPMFERLLPLVYLFSLVIWAVYLLQPERSKERIQIPLTSPLLRWNEVALALGHSGGQVAVGTAEPFMPAVERMVERVMQKEMPNVQSRIV
ncbi:MAG TPA: hypothetical protein VFQ00_13060 [Terriglobales bacterium]|nr:hypothetical protein [Terriglobales bacterium]